MEILNIAIILFIIMELANVIILFFKPDFKYGNSVSVFKDYKESTKSNRTFINYLTSWVASVKLIFIFQLLVILFFDNLLLKQLTVCVMILSISVYFFRLHGIIKKLDNSGRIEPAGYSKTLDLMIIGILVCFISSLVISFGV